MTRILIALSFLIFYSSLKGQQEAYLTYRLEAAMQEKNTEFHHVIIYLKDRLDVYGLDQEISKNKLDNKSRAKLVIGSLQTHAMKTQKDLKKMLYSHPGVLKESINEFWIANVIFARMDKDAIKDLSVHPDVMQLDLNGKLSMTESIEECVEEMPVAPGRAEVGLIKINAHKLWEMGYTGRGRLALGADTGIEPDHPALEGQYRGLYFESEQSWFSWNNVIPEPADCNGHGTHTIGTVLGIDRATNDTIGVAPNATFIGARILCSQAQGNGGTIDNVASFQWSLDPDGDPNTIDDIPDVVNNSWHDPSLDDPCENVYVDVMQAMEAVGIAVVFSAGNEGPNDATITNPHNVNYDLVNTFTVGALNGNTLNIADFSSRGPSSCSGDSSLLIKPEVSAPGAGVRSAHLDDSYQLLSGTSMAAPHVAGAILLLKEAFPYLTGRDFKLALYFTCTDLGDPGEDNTFGMGIINVEAAFNYLVAQGNDPVDPSMENDVVLFNMETKTINCDNQVPASVSIENLGSNEINELEIEYSIPELDLTETMLWSGVLPSNERITIDLDPLDVPSGNYFMEVVILKVNGEQDNYFFNNRVGKMVNSTSIVSLQADLLSEDISICKGSRAVLRSEYENVNNGEVVYVWFDRENNGFLLDTGQVFLTPELNDTVTFYAGAYVNYSLGESDNSFGEVAPNATIVGGLRFDVDLPLTLKSVKVNTLEKGLGSVVLLDSEGENLMGAIFVADGPGEHLAELNFEIPAGTGYRLEATGILDFTYNTSGANYPYTINDLITIKGHTIPGIDNTAYFFFYDWQIQHDEICGRTPVTVNVSEIDSIPQANFSMSDTIVMIDNNPTIQFTDVSIGAVSWEWDFGDGNFSMEQNPIHTYDQEGVYQVSLIVTNSLGCQDAIVDVVEVLEGTSSTIQSDLQSYSIYPNPASDYIIIEKSTADIGTNAILELRTISGKTMSTLPFNGNMERINLSQCEPGLYILTVRQADKLESFRVFKY